MSLAADEHDPWAQGTNGGHRNEVTSAHLRPTTTTNHPLRSPSPSSLNGISHHIDPSPSGTRRRTSAKHHEDEAAHTLSPGAGAGVGSSTGSVRRADSPAGVASEWRALSTGLAALFSSSSGDVAPSSLAAAAGAEQGPAVRRRAKARRSEEFAGTVRADVIAEHEGGSSKGHGTVPAGSTLERIEGWFGLGPPLEGTAASGKSKDAAVGSSSSRAGTSAEGALNAGWSSPRGGPDDEGAEGTESGGSRLVLIHPVGPHDTLSSIALYYGTDVPTLRRANKLWPSDSVQMRPRVLIPLESCKHRPPAAEVVRAPDAEGGFAFVPRPPAPVRDDPPLVDREEGRSLSPEPELPRTSDPDPASDFLPDTNKAYTRSPRRSPQLPSYLPGRRPSPARSASGRSSSPALTSESPSFDPRRSGQHDRRFLSISESGSISAASNGSAGPSGFVAPTAPVPVSRVPREALSFFPPARPRVKTEEPVDDWNVRASLDGAGAASEPDASISEAANHWYANRWTLGKSSAQEVAALVRSSFEGPPAARPVPGLRPLHLLQRSASESGGPSLASPMDVDGPTGADGIPGAVALAGPGPAPVSGGWNDAPPPDARVSHAYGGGGTTRAGPSSSKAKRLFHDLSAGLPPNAGAAANWARPINDSVPIPRRGVVAGPPHSGAAAASGATGTGTGFARVGTLFGDTLRGRISLESAFEAALEEVRASAALDLPHHAAARARARGTSTGTGAGSSHNHLTPPVPLRSSTVESPQSSGRDTAEFGRHEMEVRRSQSGSHVDDAEPHENVSSPWIASPGPSGASGESATLPRSRAKANAVQPHQGGPNTSGARPSVRKVDWTRDAPAS